MKFNFKKALSVIFTISMVCSALPTMSIISRADDSSNNLALEKTAWADGQWAASTSAEYAVDGKTDTKWCATDADSLHWLTVDLGTQTTFDTYVIRHAETGGEWAVYNTNTYFIQVSSDGENYTTVDCVSGNQTSITQRKISAVSARYVKLVTTVPNNYGDNISRICEFELYNNDYSEPAEGWTQANTDELSGSAVINEDDISKPANSGVQLSATYTGELSSENTYWMTTNNDIASVTNNGYITTKADGVTTVYLVDVYGRICDKRTVTVENSMPMINLALNKSAWADGKYDDSTAAQYAVDGSVSTKWCASDGSFLHWLVVDLGEEMAFDTYVIRHAEAGGEWSTQNTDTFFVQISNDGENFTTVDCVSGNTKSVTYRKIDSVNARYIKLVTSVAESNVSRIFEFEVYNNDYPDPLSGWTAANTVSLTGTALIEQSQTDYPVNTGIQLTAVYTGELTAANTFWMTNDPSVASVTKSGYLTTKTNGSTMLYLTDIYGKVYDCRNITVSSQNLALNKTAWADGQYDGSTSAGYAVDGNISTKWCASNADMYHWITVDLETETNFDTYVIYHAEAGGEWNSQNTNTFFLQVSNDDVNYTTVDCVSNNTKSVTQRKIEAVTARYVRIVTSVADSLSQNISRIYEIEIYNGDYAEPSDGWTAANTAELSGAALIEQTADEYTIGTSIQMTASYDGDVNSENTFWFTENTDIITVTKTGYLTALKAGTATIYLTDNYGKIYDVKTVDIVYSGDANRDGKVNILDLIRVKKYSCGHNVDICIAAADFTANGIVQADDLTELKALLLKS